MLSLSDKQKIRACIEGAFPPGEYPLPQISDQLIRGQCSHREYNYTRCMNLLADIPELFRVFYHSETGAPWVQVLDWKPAQELPPRQALDSFCQIPGQICHLIAKQYGVAAKSVVVQELEADYASALRKDQVRLEQDGRISFPIRYPREDGTKAVAYLNANKQPQNGRDWVLGYVDLGRQEAKHDTPVPEPEERIAEEKEPARSESDFPEKDLDQFCLLPDTPIRILCQLSQESAETVRRALGEDYLEALQAGMLQSSSERGERRISFPCRYRKANGEPVNIVLQMGSKYGSKEWYLKYVDCKVQPGKAIEEFAYLGWPNFLARLTEKALPESWDFENSEFKDYDILKKYITYTFYRLKLEGKICVSDDGEFAAFNTGLVDEHYNDICACFEPNHAPNTNVPWVFKEFATPGYREYGKRLNRYFNPLPRPAEYFERKEDLLYDLDQDLWCDYDHIIIDNIHRLPVNFLCSQLHDCEPAQEYLKALKGGGGDKTAAYQKLRELLEEGSTWCNRLTYRLREAIHLARKKIRWNYKTAIPSYFPTGNSMSLMLPLCLENEQKVDTVLVVELMPSGNYQGQTILTLQQAYIDARLVCRPNSEWLTTENLSNINSDVEDEDEV